MKKIQIDAQLEKILTDFQQEMGISDIEETLKQGFVFLQLLAVMHKDGGDLIYKDTEGTIIPLKMFTLPEPKEKENKKVKQLKKKKKDSKK